MDFTSNHDRQKKSKWGFWLIAITGLILLEFVLSNCTSFRTWLCKPIEVANQTKTDESGSFESDTIRVEEPIYNVYVNLELEGIQKADVVISLTDEGDAICYEMPKATVVQSAPATQYINIYPYGKVGELKVSVMVPEGARAVISSIQLNKPEPIRFCLIRLFIMGFIMLLIWVFREGSKCYTITCNELGTKGKIAILVCILTLLMIGGLCVSSNPLCIKAPWAHHKQYQELAHVMAKGSVILPYQADEALENADNPYDTIALEINQIPYRMDYAYYNGNYYVYFGVIPELLLYLPFYVLTGHDLPNFAAMYFFYAGFVIGVFGLLWEWIKRYGKNIALIQYLLLTVGICGSSNYIFLVARPDIYNIPIMAANCFTACGLFLWFKGQNAGQRKGLFYALGSLFMAMVAGCRPQMLLFSLLILVLFYNMKEERKEQWMKRNKKDILCLIIPYVLIGALVFWYNAARFGSGFDFGATYSLTSNDMNHRGFNLSRLIHGILSFFVLPPVYKSTFPYVYSSSLDVSYMGKNMTEFIFGGIFTTNLPLLILIWRLLIKKANGNKERKGIVYLLILCSFVIAVFDINGAGLLQRYLSDMVFGFLLAAALLWILTLSHEEGESVNYRASKQLCLLVILSLFISACVVFAKGDSVCLMNDNPSLFYKVASYVQFY